MNLNNILKQLSITNANQTLAPHWDSSTSSLPSTLPPFLTPENITETRQLASLAAAADPQLHKTAQQIASSPQLLHLAWHCHRLLYHHLDYDSAKIGQWPILTQALGELSGAFYLLIALAAVPQIRAVHQQLDIPDPISRDTCCHYPEPVRMYQEHHGGNFGMLPRALYWFRNHIQGDLYRLGRLEFMVKPFRGQLQAFRHRQTRAVTALANAESQFDAAGLSTTSDAANSWRASLEEDKEKIVGFPISPRGFAQNRPLTLALNEWERVLTPGDSILEIHIPGGGNMTLERCRASMQQALEFFPRYFPQKDFVGFACGSWILNPQLEQIYRPDSNMVLWQRELYLFPIPSGDRSGVYFVFGKDDIDIHSASRTTSMRRALLDHMSAGGRLIGGGMFMLLEDFEHFGTHVYHQQQSTRYKKSTRTGRSGQ
jgi:hypothetical protein